MRVNHKTHTAGVLLSILLGAVLSVLCMSNTPHHSTMSHQTHGAARITCTQDVGATNNCNTEHGVLIQTLSHLSAVTLFKLLVALLVLLTFYISLGLLREPVHKRTYAAQVRLANIIHTQQVLRWLAMLQKQNSYAMVAV